MITVCGKGVSLARLHKIEPVTPDNAGRRWKPVKHGDLVSTIEREVVGRGWVIRQETFALARDDADMAGALLLDRVANGHPATVPPGASLAIGFINSNARRRALTLTVGAHVMCCCNGVCTGQIILSRVHDHTINLVEAIRGAVDKYAIAAQDVAGAIDNLRERELAPAEAAEILMMAGRQRLVCWSALGRVDHEYRHPTFAEHGTGTSWALLNAFTYAARRNIAPTRQMQAYDAFRRLLPVAA